MKPISENFQNHLDLQATTLCRAWRLTRVDGQVLGFCEHDNDLEFDNTAFLSSSGFQTSEITSELGLQIDTSEVAGALSSELISSDEIRTGKFDGAIIEVFVVNWKTPEDYLHMATYDLGRVTWGNGTFQAELNSIAARMDRKSGRIYTRKCDANLGDHQCKVLVGNPLWQTTGTVTYVADDGKCTVDGLDGYDERWFRLGKLTWNSGANQSREVEIFEDLMIDGARQLLFWQEMSETVSIGDTFSVIAGCSKEFSQCKAKFVNGPNFQGFPHIPGNNFAAGYAGPNIIHDGRKLVD